MNTIIITNKNEVKITELVKLKGFNETKFDLSTTLGDLCILGKNLEMHNIDTVSNEIIITGDINSVKFDNNDYKEKKEGFFKKLFK